MSEAERETLERLMHYLERKSAMKDAAAIRAVLEQNERLRAALEGQPVIKSEWEEKCAEVERLRAKIKGPSSWPCGICGIPKVLECPVCGKAEIERLRERSLNWLVHLHHDCGKAGGRPEPGEREAAIESAIKALKGEK